MQSFDIENFIFNNRYPLLILLGGLILVGGGIFFVKSGIGDKTKVEVLSENTVKDSGKFITAEIAGEVINPGVYKLPVESRINDLLVISGGFSEKADRDWTEKYLNRAAKLADGQKIYVPKMGEQNNPSSANSSGGYQSVSSKIQSDSNGLININSASLNQLDALPGIGPVYGQSIIEHRPYSNVEELVSKGALKKNVYDKIKELVTIY